jgi:hypothetical protein
MLPLSILDKKEERNPKQKPPSKQLGGFKISMNHEAKAVLSDTSETLVKRHPSVFWKKKALIKVLKGTLK